MLNEFIELFVGAYNLLVPADYPDHDFFMCIMIIVIFGVVVLGCFAVAVASLVAVGRALLRKG